MRAWGLLWLTGCQQPTDPGPGAIEITGYLDASRVAWTWTGAVALAAGLEEATSASTRVSLANARSGASTVLFSGEDGAFVVSIEAALGDSLTLEASGAAESDTAHREVIEPPAFPEYVHVDAQVDPHQEGLVFVEVQLDPPREDGRLWVINQGQDTVVAALDVHEQGALHGGSVHGIEGDTLLLWFVPDAGPESAPIDVSVAPAP